MAEKFQPSPTVRRFASILWPKDSEQPILSGPVREAIHQWMTELWAAEDLLAVKVTPRRSAILSGPPGCGKTTLAHHVGARLGLPLVCVRMDSIVSQYVGQTGQNIAALFDNIEGQEDRCILFLDEFDAVASKRTSDNQSAAKEKNGIVNALLQRVESFGGTVIAATNRAEDIDPAMWRRFGLSLDIGLPGDDERYAILARYLAPFALPEDALEILADATTGAAPALLRQLAEGIKRDIVLSPRLRRSSDVKSVFARLLVSVKPHPDYPKPPLWEDRDTRERVMSLSWPPERKDAAA